MTILVTGATGNVGSHVVRQLAAHGEPVRALTRTPRDLGPGVEVATRLAPALDGCDRLFLACGNMPGQVDLECATIDAAAAAGVTRVVKLSGPAPAADAPILFDRWHHGIERHLAASGLSHVLLRPRTFMTNLLAYAPAVARTGMLFAPAADAEIAFVDPRDVAAVAVTALTGRDRPAASNGGAEPAAVHVLTGGEAVGYARIAAEMSDVTGRPVTYVPVDDDQARAAMLTDGLPPMIADAIVAIFAHQRTGAMAGTTDTIRRVTGRSPRTVAAFLHEHAGAFRAAVPSPVPPA